MWRLPGLIQNYGHRRTMASRPSRLRLSRERFETVPSYRPKRQVRHTIPLPIVEELNRGATSRLVVRRTTFLGPLLQPTLRIFNRTNVLLLQTRETLNWTRNTSNSRASYTRSRNRTIRNSSRSRNRNTNS